MDRSNVHFLPRRKSELTEYVTADRLENNSEKSVLAFCLFKYFPFGGLQRDFIRIAEECQTRGYSIRVYTLSWQGPVPQGFDVLLVPASAITNHKLCQRFYDWVKFHLSLNPVNCVIGFNKMPGLDIYYAADPCYEEKAQTQRSRLYRLLPRYRLFSRFEKAVFEPSADTEILMISEVQKPLFLKHYKTQLSRFHLLPPGIGKDRMAPEDSDQIRAELRGEFTVKEDETLLLMVGSGFITKGLDRILLGMKSLPAAVKRSTRLIVIGQDAPAAFERMATSLGLRDRVEILKGRDDIPRFLLGADFLIHPAYVENTGTVILEAIASGLPVLVTDNCGYANYVTEARAGKLVPSPFVQESFNELLHLMIISESRMSWKKNGLAYARNADIYSMPQRAVDVIATLS